MISDYWFNRLQAFSITADYYTYMGTTSQQTELSEHDEVTSRKADEIKSFLTFL